VDFIIGERRESATKGKKRYGEPSPHPKGFVISSAVEKSLVLPGASLLRSDTVKGFAALIALGLLACSARLEAAEADSTLRKVTTFAVGGVGVAGTMSEGERALRELLKQSDAAARLQRVLPEATPAAQLYALLGLRACDREVYQGALARYRRRDATVQTMSGCILQEKSFRALVKQIDDGEYDSALARQWPSPVR
jgi:hypothetical protein